MTRFPVLRWLAPLAAALALGACGGSDGDDRVALPTPQALCSSQGLAPKVANGATCASPHLSPVILLFSVAGDGSVSSCSGTAVTSTAVVTAAHCVVGARRVVAVQWRADGSSTSINASAFVPHPAYAETATALVNDVAVVRLRAPLSNPTMPLLLSQPAAAGQAVYVSGWGYPAFDLAVGLAQLQRVDAGLLGFVYDGSLSNACQGDSGGPLYRSVGGRLGLIGVTSSGTTQNCATGDNSLFTNLQGASALGFLQQQIPGLPSF